MDGVVLRVCGGVGNAIGQGRPVVMDTVSGYSVPQCLVLQWASLKPLLPKHLLSTEFISDGSGMLMPDGGGIGHAAAAPPPLIQTAASTSGSTRATSFRAMCTVPLDYLLGRHDVLDRLPALLRLVIRRFVVNPFIYQWLETARAEVEEEDGGVVTLQGATLVECAFLG